MRQHGKKCSLYQCGRHTVLARRPPRLYTREDRPDRKNSDTQLATKTETMRQRGEKCSLYQCGCHTVQDLPNFRTLESTKQWTCDALEITDRRPETEHFTLHGAVCYTQQRNPADITNYQIPASSSVGIKQ
jgi:hypothetical protein